MFRCRFIDIGSLAHRERRDAVHTDDTATLQATPGIRQHERPDFTAGASAVVLYINARLEKLAEPPLRGAGYSVDRDTL